MWQPEVLLLLTLYLTLGVPVSMAGPATFTTIDVPGSFGTAPSGINPSGEIVGAYFDAAGMVHGFLLSKGVFTPIEVPGATGTDAFGVNPAGEIVGIYFDSSFELHGFLFSKGVFTTIDVPGAYLTIATMINPAREILGVFIDGSGLHGFLRSTGK